MVAVTGQSRILAPDEAQAAETAAREAVQRRNEMGAGIYNPTTGRYEP